MSIKRVSLAERFQTIFAKQEGAVAAPTSGMDFSRELIEPMDIKGIDLADISLHVGFDFINYPRPIHLSLGLELNF